MPYVLNIHYNNADKEHKTLLKFVRKENVLIKAGLHRNDLFL